MADKENSIMRKKKKQQHSRLGRLLLFGVPGGHTFILCYYARYLNIVFYSETTVIPWA